MTPTRWQQVKALLGVALEREPSQRPKFLAEACAGDGQLRMEVESLLASHQDAGEFIETPALSTDTFLPTPVEAENDADVGRRVEDLPLKIRDVDDVAVHQRERPHAGRREIERGGRAEATGADQQDLQAQELPLALVADLGQKEVAAVTLDLVGRQRGLLDGRHS